MVEFKQSGKPKKEEGLLPRSPPSRLPGTTEAWQAQPCLVSGFSDMSP